MPAIHGQSADIIRGHGPLLHSARCKPRANSACFINITPYNCALLSGSRGESTPMVKREVGKVLPNPTLPPQRYVSKGSSVRHCVYAWEGDDSGSRHLQARRPARKYNSRQRRAVSRVIAPSRPSSFLSSVVIIQSPCAGGAEDNHAKIHSRLIIACGH